MILLLFSIGIEFSLAKLSRLKLLIFGGGGLQVALAGLGVLGIEVDPERNEALSDQARRISPDGSAVDVLVVPTDEEIAIAQGAVSLL